MTNFICSGHTLLCELVAPARTKYLGVRNFDLAHMKSHQRPVFVIVFQILLLFSLAPFCIAQQLSWEYPTGTHVNVVSMSADGSCLVSGNSAGAIDFFDTEFSHQTYLWRAMARDQVRSVALSDDGSFVVAGGNDGAIYFIDRQFAKRSPLWKFQTAGTVFSVAISGNGSYIAAGSYDHRVYYLNSYFSGSAPLWSFQTDGNVRSVAISGDGTFVVAGSEDQYVYFFEKSYRGNTFLWRLKTSAPPLVVAISNDGRYVVAGCSDGYVYFVDRDFSRDSYIWRCATGDSVESVSISQNGSYIAAGSSDGSLYFFDRELSNNQYLWRYMIGKPVENVVISRNGSQVSCAGGFSAYVFDISSNAETYTWSYDAKAEVTSISMPSNGGLLIVGDEKGFVHVLRNLIATTEFSTSTSLTTTSLTTNVAPFINPYVIPITILLAVLVFIGLFVKTRSGKSQSASLAIPSERVSTGTKALDELTGGGLPQSYSVALSSPSCDQRDLIIQHFLTQGVGDGKFTLCLTTDIAKYLDLVKEYPESFRVLLCNPQADELVPHFPNVSKTKAVENLTELNIILMEIVGSIRATSKERRVCIEILSDVLLHSGVQTCRKWTAEIVPRLKSRGFTVLGVINPSMHKKEEIEAITSVFDGEIEIAEREFDEKPQRFVAVRRLYGLKHSDEGKAV